MGATIFGLSVVATAAEVREKRCEKKPLAFLVKKCHF
jgi:hypothetical protein